MTLSIRRLAPNSSSRRRPAGSSAMVSRSGSAGHEVVRPRAGIDPGPLAEAGNHRLHHRQRRERPRHRGGKPPLSPPGQGLRRVLRPRPVVTLASAMPPIREVEIRLEIERDGKIINKGFNLARQDGQDPR